MHSYISWHILSSLPYLAPVSLDLALSISLPTYHSPFSNIQYPSRYLPFPSRGWKEDMDYGDSFVPPFHLEEDRDERKQYKVCSHASFWSFQFRTQTMIGSLNQATIDDTDCLLPTYKQSVDRKSVV